MKMKLGVFGAGGMGREVVQLATELKQWDEVFFVLDEEYIPADREISGYRVFSIDDICSEFSKAEVELVVAVGEPETRKRVYQSIIEKDIRLGRVIDPSVKLHEDTVLGNGVILLRGCILSANVTIGDNSALSFGVILGHDNQVKEHVYLAPGVKTGGFVVWDTCSFGGLSASVCQGVKIGENTIVGQGAVVLKDVGRTQTVVGNPAKSICGTKRKVFGK